VIIYGIVADIPTKSQWDGRAGRSTKQEAFCIHMIESWVLEIDTTQLEIDPKDPDHPLSDAALTKKNPTKQERTGRTSIHHATSPECERVLKAAYYEDSSPEGMSSRLHGTILTFNISAPLHRTLVLRFQCSPREYLCSRGVISRSSLHGAASTRTNKAQAQYLPTHERAPRA
jgi:hypothetical protein